MAPRVRVRGLWENFRKSPDRALSVARYRWLAEGYDDSCRYIGGIRRAALDSLAPSPGQTVFDVACGTGAMLPALAELVGPEGLVVGIEHSAEMARIARRRVRDLADHGRVALVESAVEEAVLPRMADALLFCYTHDVLQSRKALENVFRHARPGARVVVAGIRLHPWWWAWPINLWVCVRGWRYFTTYSGLQRPWEPLIQACPDLRVVRSFHLGTSYLATGHFSSWP